MKIDTLLTQIEADNKIEILFAVEAGSRAWGLDNKHSDYDVRFVYRRDATSYLLPFRRHKDHVTISQSVDAHGWDLDKMVRLLGKSNPGLYEWVMSGVTYRDHKLLRTLRNHIGDFFSTRTIAAHYGSLAKSHYSRYLLNQQEVTAKKLLYFVRAVMQLEWISEIGELPPINFNLLSQLLYDVPDVKQSLHHVIAAKRRDSEATIKATEIIPLAQWSIKKYGAWEISRDQYGSDQKPDYDKLNKLFLSHCGK